MSDTEMATSHKKKKSKKEKKEQPPAAAEAAADTPMETDEAGSPATVEIDPIVAAIASPMANKKLVKKCLKLVKKAASTKSVRRGVKEVVKAIRKGEKGLLFIAANITPIDVISHLPVLCEENHLPYIYVPSKEELGMAGATKRPTSCLLVQLKDKNAEHREAYEEVEKEVRKVAVTVED